MRVREDVMHSGQEQPGRSVIGPNELVRSLLSLY
jgi:hypothetical protein